MPKQPPITLSYTQLLEGFGTTLRNALDLIGAAHAARESSTPAGLAIAQIAQEELGKSMLLVVARSFAPAAEQDWAEFWKRWKRHDDKAHMAYWYEWLSPLRITIDGDDGQPMDGMPAFPRFSLEKEAGLYVDFDAASGTFLLPRTSITERQAFNRITAVLSLGSTASQVHDAVLTESSEERFELLSDLYSGLWKDFRSQEAFAGDLDALRAKSSTAAAFVDELRDRFRATREAMHEGIREIFQLGDDG